MTIEKMTDDQMGAKKYQVLDYLHRWFAPGKFIITEDREDGDRANIISAKVEVITGMKDFKYQPGISEAFYTMIEVDAGSETLYKDLEKIVADLRAFLDKLLEERGE